MIETFPGSEDRLVSVTSRRERVLSLLEDGAWHSTAEIVNPEVGGTEGTRRLRWLRAAGYPIEKRRHKDHDDYEYRLIPISVWVRGRRSRAAT